MNIMDWLRKVGYVLLSMGVSRPATKAEARIKAGS